MTSTIRILRCSGKGAHDPTDEPVDQNPSASVIITTAVIMANQVAVLIIHPIPGPNGLI